MHIMSITVFKVDLPIAGGEFHQSGGRVWHSLDSTVVRIATDAGSMVTRARTVGQSWIRYWKAAKAKAKAKQAAKVQRSPKAKDKVKAKVQTRRRKNGLKNSGTKKSGQKLKVQKNGPKAGLWEKRKSRNKTLVHWTLVLWK